MIGVYDVLRHLSPMSWDITACSPEGSLFEPPSRRRCKQVSLIDLLIAHYDELLSLTDLTSHDTSIDGESGK